MRNLPVVAATLAAAAASAQMSMPRIDTKPAYPSTIDAAYAKVTSGNGDYSGSLVSARLYFRGNAFALVSRNDASFDTGNLKAHQFAYGLGTTEAWGQGSVTALYARGKVSGDITGVEQNIFSVGYELGLAQSLTAGLTVCHTMNAGSVKDVTAAVFGLRYTLFRGLSLTASYSAEDTLLGQTGANRAWTFGARYSF